VLSADRRRRVAWGANAPSLSTVIAAAAMMNDWRVAASSPELANRVSKTLRTCRKKKSNFSSRHVMSFGRNAWKRDPGKASSSDAARRHDVARE
jgi:macrodomain Ter protein organizer (MatP/YcbG family)